MILQKRMIKPLCLLLVLLILVNITPTTIFAGAPISLTVSNVTGAAGTDVTVSVTVSSGSGLAAATLLLKYDNTKLTCKTAMKGAVAEGLSSINKTYKVEGNFTTINDSYLFSPDDGNPGRTALTAGGSMLDVKFTIKSGWTGSTPITLAANVYDNNYNTLSTVIQNGSANVPSIIVLTIKAGSTTLIDEGKKFIYGLIPGITKTNFESNYIQIHGNGKLVYSYSTDTLGTGEKVYLVDKSNNDTLATYIIVIFGDVNGDGNVDSIDAGNAVDVENYKVTWDPITEAYYHMAGDLNGDNNVDSIDAGIIVDVENYFKHIDQTTGQANA